jgi:glycosyltransferase involved in cell wall biosynthesis
MRILFISEGSAENPDLSGSGSPAFLVWQLRAAGHQVTTADADLSGLGKYIAALLTWRVKPQRWKALYRLSRFAVFLRSLKAQAAVRKHTQVDAILQYGATFRVHPVASTTRHFVYCDDFFSNRRDDPYRAAVHLSESEKQFAERSEQTVYTRADGIFTMSAFIRRRFTELLGIDGEKIHVVYAGINIELPPDAESIVPRTPNILFVGREFELKGGPILLEAFKLVRKKMPEATLTLVGMPTDIGKIDGAVHLGFLRKSVPNELAALTSLYQSSSVFALPTRSESFGIAVLEALVYGLPVVTTREWALPEAIIDGETGFCVPLDSVSDLAERIIFLLEHPEIGSRLAMAGKSLVISRYQWSVVVEKMIAHMSTSLKKDTYPGERLSA